MKQMYVRKEAEHKCTQACPHSSHYTC